MSDKCPPHEFEFSEVHKCENEETRLSCLIAVVKCRKCGIERGPSWIERRLRATEALSVEDALEARDYYSEIMRTGDNPTSKALKEYARILGGKDGTE